MRSRLNLAVVSLAGMFALVLTVVRRSPEGFVPLVPIGLATQEVRAAPGAAPDTRHDLSALKIFNMTLVRIKERYVDPSRIDPKKMLYSALDQVSYSIPEVLVEADTARNKVAVAVNDKREVFDTDDVDSPWRLSAKLKNIFRFIETNMNAGADLDKVEYAAVNGMLATLDPHSILMDPEQARDMDVSTSGKFGGLGIVIKQVGHTLLVVRPMRDTPAYKKGIKAGDHIVKINNELTENLSSNEAVDRMRGEPKSGVTLWVERKDVANLMRFDLVRDVIRVAHVKHKLLEHGVGYIKVDQFSKGIASDVADAMKKMSAQGATSWILDLRGNPGGLLEEAVQLSDLFVDSGTVVTTVSGRDREARRAERGFGDTTNSLAVLVNGGSASASEIVAGALKNLDRAAIIGTRTFGKGSVQELYDNDDKSKLKLTIAQYLTPGDRSIQNLGIVPDIQLQRMYVPDKNDSPSDFVRLLPPTHSYGEKDLDAHLVSTYAKDVDKPAFELPFLYVKPQPQPGDKDAKAPAPPSPDDGDDDDNDGIDDPEVVEDFEIRFAKDLVSTVSASTRPKLVAGAKALVARVRGEQDKALVAALNVIGVDWSPAAPQSDAANLDVQVATSAASIKAGADLSVTATVKNAGAGTAYRVLPRLQSDDGMFEDVELPVGKLAPGETKTFTAKLKMPMDANDRVDRLAVETHEAKNAISHSTPIEVHVEALPRPVFAYAWQLVDDGNGDGLVQKAEAYHLQVTVKNTGSGPSTAEESAGGMGDGSIVLLRNATGDGVVLGKSRFTIGALQPGQQKQFDFPLSTDNSLQGDEVVLELMAYDSNLDVESRDKLHFKLQAPIAGHDAHGAVSVRAPISIHAGADPDSSLVGTTKSGASYTTLGIYGAWTKVKLDANRVGFLPTAAVFAGGTGGGSYAPYWNSTPPQIALDAKTLVTSGDTFKLVGSVTDESHLEDIYVFVANQSAKIEAKKVFYRSNRGGKDGRSLSFTADIPMYPGSNAVTVVARESSEVRSLKTLYVYRDPPRTAQAP
jgi:carboxyl-terminal processing protease